MPSPSWLTGWIRMNQKHAIYSENQLEQSKYQSHGCTDSIGQSVGKGTVRTVETSDNSTIFEQRRVLTQNAAEPHSRTFVFNSHRDGNNTNGQRIGQQSNYRIDQKNEGLKKHVYLNETAFLQAFDQRFLLQKGTAKVVREKDVVVPKVCDGLESNLKSAKQQKHHCIPNPLPSEQALSREVSSKTFNPSLLESSGVTNTGSETLKLSSDNIVVSCPHLPSSLDSANATNANTYQSNNDHVQCPHCKILESQLNVARCDIEYMKQFIAQEEEVQRTKVHSKCPGTNDFQISSLTFLQKQLKVVNQRHKTQIESMTKHIVQWQNNVVVKQQKLKALCIGLNEESATRKDEAQTLRKCFESAKQSRDELALENVDLRAALEDRNRERAEHEKLKEQYVQYELHGLKSANHEVGVRDRIIEDLTSKLSLALDRIDQLEAEKLVQRNKRQIIFPKP